MSRADFDWDRIEDWVITQSGSLTLRQMADQSGDLATFGYKHCDYQMLREVAKERLWLDKRTEWQAERYRNILDDYRRSYDIITKTIDLMESQEESDINARDLAQMGQLQLAYGKAIMALNPTSAGEEEIEILSRDDVLEIASEVFRNLEAGEPADVFKEKTPQ